MKKLLLTLSLSVALVQPLMAAQPQPGEKLATNQNYTFWLLDAIKTLDPQANTDVEGSDVIRTLFEGLMNEGPDGELVPGVATGYDLSEDKLTYTFHLRPEAKWSNGEPVTAQDFVYAWKRLADPKMASEYAFFLELMQIENAHEITAGEKPVDELGVKATDDHTFVIKIKTPLPFLPQMVVHASLFPVLKSVVEKNGDKWTQTENIVGNGAYTVSENVPGVKIVMKRNPNYWDNAHTVLDTVTALTVNDTNQALTRYLANELDRVQIPAGQYPRLAKEYPDQATSTPYSCTYAYLFNVSPKGPEALKDVRVRKALSYGINRDVIVNNILQGGQKPAYNWTHWATAGFTMPDIDYSKWSQKEREEKAAALLKEAGFGPDKPLELTLNYNTSEDHKKIAIAVAQFWKKLGVNLTLNNMEWKVHTDKMQNQDFQVARYAWCGDYNEPSTYLDMLASYSGTNYPKFSNPEYDKLMKDSKTAADPQPLYTQAEKILADEMPLAPIYQYAKVDMIKPDIKGIPKKNVMQTWYAKDIYRVAK